MTGLVLVLLIIGVAVTVTSAIVYVGAAIFGTINWLFLAPAERVKRAMQLREPSPFNDIEDGATVMIEGVVSFDEDVVSSTLDGIDCAVVQLRLERPDRGGTRTREGVIRDIQAVPFIVTDPVGRTVRVNTTRPWLLLREDTTRTNREIAADPAAAARLESRLGRSAHAIIHTTRPMIISESLVLPDDTVTVIGTARKPSPTGGAYRQARAQLIIEPTLVTPVMIADTDTRELPA